MLIYLQIIESDADRDKFEQLYYYYRDYMFHIANRIVKNEYDAEDAVHSAFESIAKNIGKLGNVECSKTRALCPAELFAGPLPYSSCPAFTTRVILKSAPSVEDDVPCFVAC